MEKTTREMLIRDDPQGRQQAAASLRISPWCQPAQGRTCLIKATTQNSVPELSCAMLVWIVNQLLDAQEQSLTRSPRFQLTLLPDGDLCVSLFARSYDGQGPRAECLKKPE